MEYHVEQIIHAAPSEVARIMFDPEKEVHWIGNAKSVERLTPGPIGVGSRVRHEGGLLGQAISWVTEVTAYEPDRQLEMSVLEAPLPGVLIYEVRPTAGGSIAIVQTKNFASVPGAGWALKRAAQEDLARLAALVMHPPA
jgi:hypothetical protein